MTYDRLISIHGVPRSGTSWLGQIFNKHSRVAYRFQPLFSYRFRGRISTDSSAEDIRVFLDELFLVTDDDFIAGRWPKSAQDEFAQSMALYKQDPPDVMVMKEVRYHQLIEKFIDAVPEVKIVGIVRNPCAVINSWLHNPKEFSREWDPMAEWRCAPSKNQAGAGEYFGYEKWKELTTAFLDFQRRYPKNFLLVRYEQLVTQPVEVIRQAFTFTGLDVEEQVVKFLGDSQSHHVDDPYAVYKSPNVKDRWKSELDATITQQIVTDLKGSALESFLA